MEFTARSKSGKELKVEAIINDEYKPEYFLSDYDMKIEFNTPKNTPAIHLTKKQVKDVFNVDMNGAYVELADYQEWEKKAITKKLKKDDPVINLSLSFDYGTSVVSSINLPRLDIESILTEMYENKVLKFSDVSDDYTRPDYQIEIKYSEIIDMIKNYKNSKGQKKEAKNKKYQEQVEAAKKEAAEKNENIEISRATVDCDGSAAECSTDILIQFVTPSGKLETQRIHTH